ncbi:response regulator transcription factor [Geomonas sp. Red32]|uniref:response regulator transcription factor n=1 Tax=Geomonas sp. Red32 TaxID=2912856 RepID=UPI00202CCC33|nr:response regulator transcription factor [Geomonas sp. Red32]MCM0082929.1 response regulator transcription factor [Geomonas sp. Red32]
MEENGYTIVLIEDDPSYRDMVELILGLEGFRVLSAVDGEQGLELVRQHRPHLVLCDIMMPGMDGHRVLETVRNDPQLAELPFIFVTAMGERGEIRSGMAAGADDYLPKPFSADELVAAVTGRLRRHLKGITGVSVPLPEKENARLLERVTPREREVLALVGEGCSSRAISERLGISHKTVEVHRANLMRKLGAGNAVGLARWAMVAGRVAR